MRAINLYSEQIEKGARAGQLRLRDIPGLTLFKQVGTGPIRGTFANETELFVVSGGTLWQVFNDDITDGSTNVNIGPVNNAPNPAIIRSNGFQLAISSGGQMFIVPGGGAGVIPIVDSVAGQPVLGATLAFMDQYFICNPPNTKQIFISNLAPAGATWDPGDTALKESYSDNISCVWVDQPGGEYLWLFGNDTIEVWTDTAGLFPFSRVPGLVFSIGCDSAWSVAGAAGFRAWIWHGVIYGSYGVNAPQRVSDSGVEYAISTYSLYDQQNAEAFSWIDGTHIFYAISFPQAGATWVFDASTQQWHERLYYFNGAYGRYRPRVYAYAFGMDIGGDYASGTLYQMDPNSKVDAPAIATPAGAPVPLRRERICPYVSDSMKNDRYNRLTLDMDTGIGLQVASGQPGYDPQISMRYSKDRGKTWSSYRQQSLGRIGNNQKRVFWTQLGAARIGMDFDVVVTDPVPVSINAAFLDIGPGNSPGNRPAS